MREKLKANELKAEKVKANILVKVGVPFGTSSRFSVLATFAIAELPEIISDGIFRFRPRSATY